MDFDFQEVFKRISEEEISKITPEILLMQKRHDEYDTEFVAMHAFNTALSINLLVTKRVFEEYHNFIMKKL